MSQEILYTSAPEGLKAGSRGFCTVVSTAGMASNLAERLESLSGYRQAYAANDAKAAQNPINYSHSVLTVGGRKYHILSSVRDAGMDYSQRSNKLAHHVALEQSECVPGGPAWVLSSPGFCETAWDGKTKLLPAGRKAPSGGRAPGVCEAWKKLTGDAGWAGVLAESALERGGRPVSVIYPPGANVLPLVVEAESLLPPDRRWEVTFSTYFTKLPAGVECQWRFLLDGTPEAQALRRNVHATVIDLCRPLGEAKGGSLVAAARRDAAEAAQKSAGGVAPGMENDGVPVTTVSRSPYAGRGDESQAAAGTYDLQRRPMAAASAVPQRPGDGVQPGRNRSLLKYGIAVGVAGAFLFAFTAGAAFYFGQKYGHKPDVNTLAGTKDQGKTKQTDDEPPEREPDANPDQKSRVAKTSEASDREPVVRPSDNERPPVTPVVAIAPTITADVSPVESAPPKLPLADVRAKGAKLLLPEWRTGTSAEAAPFKLAELHLERPNDCKLELVGGREVAPPRVFRLESKGVKDAVAIWSVKCTANLGESEIAEFQVKTDGLSFRWINKQSAVAGNNCLRYCLLRVQTEKDSELCQLCHSNEVEPKAFRAEYSKPYDLSDDLSVDATPGTTLLQFDVALAGFSGHPEVLTHLPLFAPDKKQTTHSVVSFGPANEMNRYNGNSLEFGVRLNETNDRRRLLDLEIRCKFSRINDFDSGTVPSSPTATASNIKKFHSDNNKKQTFNNITANKKEKESQLPGLKDKARMQSDATLKKAAETEVDTVKGMIEKYEDLLRVIAANDAWFKEIWPLMQQMEKDARIHYRAYIVIEGREIEIVHTKGFPRAVATTP